MVLKSEFEKILTKGEKNKVKNGRREQLGNHFLLEKMGSQISVVTVSIKLQLSDRKQEL